MIERVGLSNLGQPHTPGMNRLVTLKHSQLAWQSPAPARLAINRQANERRPMNRA